MDTMDITWTTGIEAEFGLGLVAFVFGLDPVL